MAEVSRYPRPTAAIDPDLSKSWIGRALPIVKAHKVIFLTSITLTLLAIVFQVEIPNLVRLAIDKALPATGSAAVAVVSHRASLGFYITLIIGFATARLVIGYISRRYLMETAYAIEADFRNLMYEQFSRLSFGFYDRVQSGQLISRANSDIRAVQMYLTFGPFIMAQSIGLVVIAFIFMVRINVPLAFVAMGTMPFVFWSGVRMRSLMFPISWVVQARLADVATIVEENASGIRVVKSFAAEPQQLSGLTKSTKRVEWANIKQADIRAQWAPLIENLPRLGMAFVLLYGGWLVIHHQGTVGAIVAFNAYVLMLQAPFRQLGMILMLGQRASASADRIYEVLDEQPEITDRPGAVDLVECHGEVRFDHVTFSYVEGRPVLEDFDLRLAAGQTVALVGRTGTGKSTVGRLMTRFYDVDSGAVTIEGHDVRDLTLASLRAQVGVVLDEPFLFSVSIRDNIAFGKPTADLDEIVRAAQAAAADDFIRELPEGYDTVIGERGYTLSGGQRQRIAIARTLLVNPPVLILDDATSAIDVQVEQDIHEALRTLMEGRTTLIIAHRLSTISLADRVVLLQDGHIVADGTHAELLATEPRYSEVLAQVAKESGEEPPDTVGLERAGDLVPDGRSPAATAGGGGA
ncbi:MAG TPA: ABC transporter ATP-binding protein [Acidimicrobiales bacterium]|nr:ABC transporter ATP-binding protein [Acidimicrobiales bacterium]